MVNNKRVSKKKNDVKKTSEIREVSASQKKKPLLIGKYKVTKGDIIALVLMIIFIIVYAFSPRYYAVTTGLYNKSTKEDQKNVERAMGKENTEERFETYFQWYNVIHELAHGLLYYNDGKDFHIVDEEQIVNDFAVAYWKHCGDEERILELENIVNYAVMNVGTNYEDGVDYIKLGKENSNNSTFNNEFFNFNDYGWFQFSSVKNSFKTNKSLDKVLKEMGIKDYKLSQCKVSIYDEIDLDTSTKIINDAVDNFNEWGLKFPSVLHDYDEDPNNNYSRPVVKFLGLLEMVDFSYLFS